MSDKRYIKGKDGKLMGSLPGTPNLPTSKETIVPPVPVSTNNPIEPSEPHTLSKRFEEMNRLEKETNNTLADGFAEIGKAFEEIENILKERQERNAVNLEIAKQRSHAANLAAIEAREKYEKLIAEREARKPLNIIRKFLGIK